MPSFLGRGGHGGHVGVAMVSTFPLPLTTSMLSAINPITYVESLKFLSTSKFLLQLPENNLTILKNVQFTYSTSLRVQLLVALFCFAKLAAQLLNLAHI